MAFNQVNMVYALEVYQYGKFGFTNTDYILSKSTDNQSLKQYTVTAFTQLRIKYQCELRQPLLF